MSTAVDFAGVLNPHQLEAVRHGEGPQLVLAGAGSGKTRVITHRIAWLIQEADVDPRSIVAVTFTNKAATEMRERVEKLLGRYDLDCFVGTFHRFALVLLRRYGDRVDLPRDFVIFDADDQLALVKEALKAEQLSESSFPPRAVRAAISAAKNRMVEPRRFEAEANNFFDQRIAKAYHSYQRLLAKAGGVDFDDMLMLSVRLLSEPELRERMRRRIRHLLVDEFQDTNMAQMQMVLELAGADGNITAVGDEDQGIYRWRGADLENVLAFEKSFPGATVRKLEQNYRSTGRILEASGALVANNRKRRGKRLWTASEQGEPLELYRAGDEQDEARWIVSTIRQLNDGDDFSLSEMGILVRTNAQTRALEEELLRRQLPYSLVGGVRFYQRAEIKDVVAYLRVVRNPRDDHSLSRILNQPPRGIGKASRQLLEEAARSQGQSLWDVLLHDEMGAFPDRAQRALRNFRDMILDFQDRADELPLPALLEYMLEVSKYPDLYKKKDPESEAKLENLREFLTAAQEMTESRGADGTPGLDTPGLDTQGLDGDGLTAFLDHIALVSDVDEWQSERGVSLMTLHSAKGLEFSVVALAGLEEGLLPHFNASGSDDEIEEERRLVYVGMTRARERLFLSTCRRRRIAGRYQDQLPSRYLDEIPAESLTVSESSELFRGARRTRGVRSFFDRADDALDYELEPTEDGAKKGRRVRHPKLGSGVIMDLEGEGDEMKLTVFFDRAGKRKLIAKYASLEWL